MTSSENDKSRYLDARDALGRGQFSEALAILEELEAQGSSDPEYWRLRGVSAHRSGDPEAAEGFLRRAVELDRSRAASWTELAKHYEELRREKEALATYREALADNPNSAELNMEMGRFFQFQAAGIAVSNAGIDPRVKLMRGSSNNHHRKAAEFFEKAYSRKSQLSAHDRSGLLAALCHVYWFLGEKRKARKFLKELKRFDPSFYMIGHIELTMGTPSGG